MKHYISALIFACVLAFATSCSQKEGLETSIIDENIDITIGFPDNSSSIFSKMILQRPTGNSDEIYIVASTSGMDVYSYLQLSIHIKGLDDLYDGDEVRPVSISLSRPLSSSTYDTATQYTGTIYLKGNSRNPLILNMDNVAFKLSDEEFTLNGDLVCTFQ